MNDRTAAARFFIQTCVVSADLTDRSTAVANDAEWLVTLVPRAANLREDSKDQSQAVEKNLE